MLLPLNAQWNSSSSVIHSKLLFQPNIATCPDTITPSRQGYTLSSDPGGGDRKAWRTSDNTRTQASGLSVDCSGLLILFTGWLFLDHRHWFRPCRSFDWRIKEKSRKTVRGVHNATKAA
ncbi:hypothetical protein ACTXT7_000368 [Hymenolepis weldensis]